MSNVVPLNGASVESDARAEFVRHLTESFDYYVEQQGVEPEALVFTWCGIRQNAHTGHMVRGDSEGGVTTVQALALASLTKAIVNPE